MRWRQPPVGVLHAPCVSKASKSGLRHGKDGWMEGKAGRRILWHISHSQAHPSFFLLPTIPGDKRANRCKSCSKEKRKKPLRPPPMGVEKRDASLTAGKRTPVAPPPGLFLLTLSVSSLQPYGRRKTQGNADCRRRPRINPGTEVTNAALKRARSVAFGV